MLYSVRQVSVLLQESDRKIEHGCILMTLVDSTDIAVPKRRTGRATKPQLLTRDRLDGRTNAAKLFERLINDIELDLGGAAQLSTIERALIAAFAGACVTMENLNTRLALGETIDLSEHAQAVSAMVRVASRLGLQRRAKDVGSSLGDLLRQDHERQQREKST
jgi:hypothetical protein